MSNFDKWLFPLMGAVLLTGMGWLISAVLVNSNRITTLEAQMIGLRNDQVRQQVSHERDLDRIEDTIKEHRHMTEMNGSK